MPRPSPLYPDPDVIVIDPLFNKYRVNNNAIVRLWTGAACGRKARPGAARDATSSGATCPTIARCAGCRTTAASPSSAQPSNNGNGNTFDFQGRQLTCEHLTRRVVRYEHDGSVTVILADNFNGKHFNSPNDLAPHPDGSIWFTDPFFGDSLYEGVPDAPGGFGNEAGHLKQHVSASPPRWAT
jgi:gluconolactonase